MQSDVVELLQPYSSCDIADALSKLGDSSGGYLPGIKSIIGQDRNVKCIGRAFTVKMEPVDSAEQCQFEGHYLDYVKEGDCIIASSPRGYPNAVFGGLMSLRAKYMKAAGVVIDGHHRDTNELLDNGFPTYSRGSSCLGASKFTKVSAIQLPVSVQFNYARIPSFQQSVIITPGDVIVADIDGVVCCPQAKVREVAELCARLTKQDNLCAQDIQQGMSIKDAFKKNRE
ncbi:hypothetical protein MIR68_007226 [Amoeboaphelidium protococcarum]|nr:hypothetical protein MIR68_007226 [Amoeboaphelidium protococcarum]